MSLSAVAAIRWAAASLAAGGIDSARAEAELLVAYVLGCERSVLHGAGPLDLGRKDRLEHLVGRRVEERIPLQYLLGRAPSGLLDLEVGPGVFIPRPETELLLVAAIEALDSRQVGDERPVVVDLCAGSGTLALEIAHARPKAEVHAVELHEAALGWLRRNARTRAGAGDTPIHIHHADATDPNLLAEVRGTVDVVVSNPPYIPETAILPEDVAGFEPHSALFGGPDGLSVIRPLVSVAAGLLRPGGQMIIEHDDATGAAVAALAESTCGLGTVERHSDLAGRARFVTATRRTAPGSVCEQHPIEERRAR